MKIGASGMLAFMSAVMATPSASELAESDVWRILAERYPFIFVAVISVAGLLWFIRDMSNAAAARELARDQSLFVKFEALRVEDRAAQSVAQQRFLADFVAVSERCHATQDRMSIAMEQLLARDTEAAVSDRETREVLRELRDYLRDVSRQA